MNQTKVEIFLEGTSDKKFFEDYLMFMLNKPAIKDLKINNVEGKDKLIFLRNAFIRNRFYNLWQFNALKS